MNGYQFNNIIGWVLLLLGGIFGLVLGVMSDWVQDNFLTVIIVCLSLVILVTGILWRKINPFEKKLKEFEV